MNTSVWHSWEQLIFYLFAYLHLKELWEERRRDETQRVALTFPSSCYRRVPLEDACIIRRVICSRGSREEATRGSREAFTQQRRCGGAAPTPFDAPSLLLTLLLSIMYGALPPCSPPGNIAAPPFKGWNPPRRSTSPPFSLQSFSSFLPSFLLFAPSVPHPLSFFLFSLSPHFFIHPPLLSHLFLIPIFSLLYFHLFPSSPHLLSLSLHFLTSFPLSSLSFPFLSSSPLLSSVCFLVSSSFHSFPHLLPSLSFILLYLSFFLSTFPLFASSSPVSSSSSSYFLIFPSFFSFSPHLHPTSSNLMCSLIHHHFLPPCLPSFSSLFLTYTSFLLSFSSSTHFLSFLWCFYSLTPFFSSFLPSSSRTFYLPSPLLSLCQQSFCHPFFTVSLFVFFPLVLPPVPLPFYLLLPPLPPCHGCMSASLICGLSAGPCYPPDGALFLGWGGDLWPSSWLLVKADRNHRAAAPQGV